jgi:hypothetical protein
MKVDLTLSGVNWGVSVREQTLRRHEISLDQQRCRKQFHSKDTHLSDGIDSNPRQW